jgi:hypothetical protein
MLMITTAVHLCWVKLDMQHNSEPVADGLHVAPLLHKTPCCMQYYFVTLLFAEVIFRSSRLKSNF